MKKATYRQKLSSAKKNKWNEAIIAGNETFAIWTDLRIDDEFRKMALMAETAPTPDSYNYLTGSSVKTGNYTHTISPACIKHANDLRPKGPIRETLKNPQLANEYGEAILFWLRNTEISMVDIDRDTGRQYQYAIEILLSVLPEDSVLAGELFAFHPVNFCKEYFGKVGTKDFYPDSGQYRSLIHQSCMPRKYVVAAVKALIEAAKLQEAGVLPKPLGFHGDHISLELRKAIADDPFGAFYMKELPKEIAKEVFGLIYDFLKDSDVPFYRTDITAIAQNIENEEERFAFCVRTIRVCQGCLFDNEELLIWVLDKAKAREDSETVEFIDGLLAEVYKAQDAKKADSHEIELLKERANKKRSETFEALFAS